MRRRRILSAIGFPRGMLVASRRAALCPLRMIETAVRVRQRKSTRAGTLAPSHFALSHSSPHAAERQLRHSSPAGHHALQALHLLHELLHLLELLQETVDLAHRAP